MEIKLQSYIYILLNKKQINVKILTILILELFKLHMLMEIHNIILKINTELIQK